MPESDATHNEQQAPPTEKAWHDKILSDAIGYTKGLVTILDSLNEGFHRRGRELEEMRHRLTILQNERRTILEERGGLETQMGSLTAERDELRSSLEERRRDLDQLRDALGQSQAALEARTREIQEIQAATRDSTRQAGELREVVRDLERELLRVRQSAAQAQQEQVALRDNLVRTEGLLETARKDLTGSQGQIARLQGSLRAQVDSLTIDRKRLQLTLEERDRALDQLRQESSQSQAAQEARAREIQPLQAAVAESTRQGKELRERIRELERERESDAHRHATRLAETEGVLQQVRESAARAQQEQVAVRDNLARTEGLLETARRDLTGSEEQIASLRGSAENERARAEDLQDRLRAQWQDFSSLNTTMEAARSSLREIAAIVGGPPDLAGEGGEADQEGTQWAELVQRVRLQTEASAQTQDELATLRRLAESVQEVLGATDALPERLRKVVAERALLTERLQRIAAEWRRLRQERMEAVRREQQLREENEGLAARVAALTGELETQRAEAEQRRLPPASDRQAQMAEAASEQQGESALQPAAVPGVTSSDLDARKAGARATTPPGQADLAPGLLGLTRTQVEAPGSPGDSPPHAGPHRVDEEVARRQGRLAGVVVECTLASSGEETVQPLRGRISGINEVGMVGAFERRLSAGQELNLRLLRGDREFAVPGRVAEVQPSVAAPGAPPSFDHLVRFDHPDPDSAQRLRVFLFS